MRLALGSVVLLLLASAVLVAKPLPAAAVPPRPAPAAAPPYDIAPWWAGDAWSYDTQIITASPDGTRTNTLLRVNETVGGIAPVTVLGRTYTVYNSTVSGSALSTGDLNLGGGIVVSYRIGGPLFGWIWNDRSDLALVAENQTTRLFGQIQYLIFNFNLWLNTTATVRHGPAEEDLDFPLRLGDAWSYDGIVNTTGYMEYVTNAPTTPAPPRSLAGETNLTLRSWFNRTESKTVGTLTFPETARIHSVTSAGAVDRWYDPNVRNYVAAESHDVRAPDNYTHVWLNLTNYALVPAPWPGTITLNPSRVNPGGWVTANGTARPDEPLVVRIPDVGASYPAQANATGAWSLAFRAPTVDDDTPSNADVGSHGVIVELAAVAPGGNVTTLELILPDLYAAPPDLTFSDPAPLEGVAIDVNGTVHVGPEAPVASDFNVTFFVDGVEAARRSTGNLTAGDARTFGFRWSGGAGPHTFVFAADADNAIRETNETNNTATRTVLVRGPDLAPMNVTVVSDTTDAYPDPAAVGYVSRPAQGRLGGTVNVTFQVENVGSAAVDTSFVVSVVETLGLFGPPQGAPLLEATVSPPLAPGDRTVPFNASWPVPLRPGVYHLNVTADAAGQVRESSEANNTFAIVVNVSGPDYRIVSVIAPAKASVNSTHVLNVTVRNDGQLPGDRPAGFAAFQGANPLPFYEATIPALAVSETHAVAVPWQAPEMGGVVTLHFAVDPNGTLDEMNETNNGATATVDVRPLPVTTLAVVGLNATTTRGLFVTSNATFLLAATDFSDTQVTVSYRLDAGPVTTFASPFGIASEGLHTIEYWGADGLGGTEAPHAFAVHVDDSAPETSHTAYNRTGDRVTVALSASDGDGVGVDYVEYRVDGGPWQRYEGPFDVAGYGAHNVTYRAVDLLGHWEREKGLSLPIEPGTSSAAVNWKPALAAVFAAVLLVAAYYAGRRQRGWSLGSPRLLGIVFAAAELATGGISVVAPVLAVPPYGLGLAVDLVILLVGLLSIWFARRGGARPAEAPPSEEEPAAESSTGK